MRVLIAILTTLMHILTSPVTLALSVFLVAGTWIICQQVRRRQSSDGAELLLTSEWLGA